MGEKLTFFEKLCATLGPKLVLPRSAKEAASEKGCGFFLSLETRSKV